MRFNPFFDRFDICNAYYAFTAECHGGQWSDVYAIWGRLYVMRFKPATSGGSWDTLDDNEREIYCNAWLHYYPGQPLPDDCQEWVRDLYVLEFIDKLTAEGALNETTRDGAYGEAMSNEKDKT